jgi:hypothetical protein
MAPGEATNVLPGQPFWLVIRLQKVKVGYCYYSANLIQRRAALINGGSAKSVKARWLAILLVAGCFLSDRILMADNVAVRYKEGLTHGFLVLSTLDGNAIAVGDLTEVVKGRQVTTRLIFHFKDGSLQDETTVFSQGRNFSLISYHLIQKGPIFPHPSDFSVATSTGQVTVRSTDDKGKEKVENERMKLPSDLANGMVLTLLKNLDPDGPLPQLSVVVATPKPRIVKLSVRAQGKEPFSLAGSSREAIHYVLKIEIGGVTGLLAQLLGKEPPDAHVWIIGGEAPTFVKSEALSYLGGPVWRTELTSPVWPKAAEAEKKGTSESKP